MIGRPEDSEAIPYYFKYVNQVSGDDPVVVLRNQLADFPSIFSAISEETSRYRYAPEKWSIRQVVNHLSDSERLFCFRAFWFARGFDSPLPSFDQEIAARGAPSDQISWAMAVEELRHVRLATVSLFGSLTPEAWTRRGFVNDSPFSVRALAYIIAGHVTHHIAILKERYLLQEQQESGTFRAN